MGVSGRPYPISGQYVLRAEDRERYPGLYRAARDELQRTFRKTGVDNSFQVGPCAYRLSQYQPATQDLSDPFDGFHAPHGIG